MNKIDIVGFDEVIYYDKCDNGLPVYIWVNDRVKSVFASLGVKYGSIHTEFKVKDKTIKVPAGTAHFLEHIKFNETGDTTAHDFYHKSGAEVNAFTTFDYTSYHFVALNKYEENLVHLLDFVQMPYFNKEMIEKEKGIIIEEEKMGEDDPDTINYFGIFKNLLNTSKYKDLVTGTVDDIKKTSLKDIENVFHNFYHPENMFLVITGNVNPYHMMEVVKQNQNNKVFEKYTNPKIIKEKESKKVAKELTTKVATVVTPKIKVGVKIPRNKFKDYTDLELRIYLNLILSINFGNTSDFKDFLLENKLATSISAMSDIYDDYVIIIVSFESKYHEEVEKLVKEKLYNMEINKETVERKNKAQLATLILSYDDIEKVNYTIQDNIVNYNDVLGDIKKLYENITVNTLDKLIKELCYDNITTFVLRPPKEGLKQ